MFYGFFIFKLKIISIMVWTEADLQKIKTKPLSNGRYYALHKYLYWVENPVLWLYEKQGFTSLYFEGTEDLRPDLNNYYLDYGYYQFDERKQILDDLTTLLYMWNLKFLQLNSLINSLGHEGDSFKNSHYSIVALLETMEEIVNTGNKAGLWSFNKVSANGIGSMTFIGEISSGLAQFKALLAPIEFVANFVQNIINKDFAEKVQARTIANIGAIQEELDLMIGTEYYTNKGQIGGYLKGLLDLAGMKIVTDSSGNVKIVNDTTNPNNPNYKNTSKSPANNPQPIQTTNQETTGSNALKYIGIGLLGLALLKKKR
jgi:hypothetical protein